jgi:hypothetical protein
MRGTLIILVKAPVAGRVKTRLARSVGAGRAAAVFRVLTSATIAAAARGPWRTLVAVDPPSAVGTLAASSPPQIAQARGDLGARLRAAFAGAPEGPVIVIGADAPALRAADIRRGFAALKGADAAFGPSEDGGFWLVGLARRRAARGLFRAVRWSTPQALADACASLPPRWRIAYLDRLRDVDTADDLALIGAGALHRSTAPWRIAGGRSSK